MMKRDSPGPWIKIETFVEFHMLRCATQLSVGVSTVKRPISSARPIVVLKHLYFVADFPQLIGGCHSGDPRAQNQNRGSFDVARELDWATEIRLSRVAHCQH